MVEITEKELWEAHIAKILRQKRLVKIVEYNEMNGIDRCPRHELCVK